MHTERGVLIENGMEPNMDEVAELACSELGIEALAYLQSLLPQISTGYMLPGSVWKCSGWEDSQHMQGHSDWHR